jgi:hypothetical protein
MGVDQPLEIRKVFVSAKCGKTCLITLIDETDAIIDEHFGHPPVHVDALSDDGDWITLEIDNATGYIIGWKPIETLKAPQV